MYKELVLSTAWATVLAGCSQPSPPPASSAPAAAPLVSGIDLHYVDDSVRPQDDFYKHINGKWLATAVIPADRGSYGSFDTLHDESLKQLHGIVESLQTKVDAHDPDQQKIADLFSDFMDAASLEALALKPLGPDFARIDALTSPRQIAGLVAHFNMIGVGAPFTPYVHQDAKDPTRYVFDLTQDGLGMPDRDYYLLDDAKMQQARNAYRRHVETMLELAGFKSAKASAAHIVDLETELARIQWTKVESRDPVKAYNKVEIGRLASLAQQVDWTRYLADAGVTGRADYLVISQPSYIAGLDRLLQHTPLSVWQDYFRWRLLGSFAPYLSKPLVDASFAFNSGVLRDIPENKPRWERGLDLIENSIGESLGKLYVARFFPPEAKARMDRLVQNLLAAYKADIDTLDWMSPETRKRAQDKLAKFTTKIGYPVKWRDYSTLEIVRGDLVGNIVRAQTFEYRRNLEKLGKPIDRDEWDMTPQTINAYYQPEKNEIVFPAAILQPPFFNARADDAVNYGGIGAVIGHEISHGFDDQGSQYDGAGILLNPPGWFTQADLDKFKARTRAMVAQYAAFEPVPGYHVNGELTLGENIADNAGLAIALKAYRLSLAGKPAPVLDGMTGDQRFFAGWAQVWRGKTRVNTEIVNLKIDPHSPLEIRGTVPETNQAAFFDTFGIKDGDKMYVAPDQRITLW